MINSIEYKCLNAIGNTLNLDKMLTEIISTFIQLSGAIGGAYLVTLPHPSKIITIGKEFVTPILLSHKIDGYEIYPSSHTEYMLDIPIEEKHLGSLFSITLPINSNKDSNSVY